MKKYFRPPLLAGALFTVLLLALPFLLPKPGTPVPVLMYHHFTQEDAQADTVVSARHFEEQLQALLDAGFTPITLQQLLDYCDQEAPLPQKPVLITMDDGYTSNLEIAAPILARHGACAAVFTIGINVGQQRSPHTQQPLSPTRFSWEQARPWVESGILTVQSHTYDLHQRADYGISGRDGVLPLPDEDQAHYRAALAEDLEAARKGLAEGLDCPLYAVAFPFGLWTQEAVDVYAQEGVRLTFTTQYGVSRVIPHRPDSLHTLDRIWVNDISGPQLVEKLEHLVKKA